jgi:hypothetical protein
MADEVRPLQSDERAVLSLLLAEDFDGADALREQARDVSVVGHCDCGCPSIYLAPPSGSPRAHLTSRLATVEGRVTPESDGEPPGEIILFVDDGKLSYLEYVYYGSAPRSWPPTSRITTAVQR